MTPHIVGKKENKRVRYRIIQRVVFFVVMCSLAWYLGCATPKPCTVSPVDIEEIKSDIRDLNTEIAKRNDVRTKLDDEVTGLEARLTERQALVPNLQAELERVKKESGVTPQSAKPDSTATADSTITSRMGG
jgi:septal ring factor EnvC (AmiA/AmiB activator)